MVYASWTISEQEYYNNTLAWLEQEYLLLQETSVGNSRQKSP